MTLFQILRFITIGTPICIFDIMGVEICDVSNKNDIPIDLLEYEVQEITSQILLNKFNVQRAYICIMLQK